MKYPTEYQDHLPESGIYRFYDDLGRLLYVGKATNLPSRLAQHEQQHSLVQKWIEYFGRNFVALNLRLREADWNNDARVFDHVSKSMAWPLTNITSFQPVDCDFSLIDRVEIDDVSSIEIDAVEHDQIRQHNPPFNYTFNTELSWSVRARYHSRRYLKCLSLFRLLNHISNWVLLSGDTPHARLFRRKPVNP